MDITDLEIVVVGDMALDVVGVTVTTHHSLRTGLVQYPVAGRGVTHAIVDLIVTKVKM